MAEHNITGKCLCAKVTIVLGAQDGQAMDIGACHCVMCRKWSGGGPFLALENNGRMQVDGHKYVGVYKSSDWAERAFCSNCGTALYYHLLPTGEKFVSAGLFGPKDKFIVAKEIFIDQKPHYYDQLNTKSVKKTAEQVIGENS